MNERASAPRARSASEAVQVDPAATASPAESSSFDFLFDATPTPILVLHRETLRFIAINDAALAFYGYSREEFLQLRLPDIRPEKMQGEIEGMIARFDDPSLPEVPRLHLTKGGERKIVKVNARTFVYEGVPAILAAVFDITRQHDVERELRRVRSFLKNLVDRVPAAVFAKDAETGQYVFYNSAAETLFGLSQEDVIGQTSADVYGPEVAREFQDQDLKARHAGTSGVVFEHTLHDVDGGKRHLRIKKVMITDGDAHDKQYILAVAEDVTDERVREARISHLASHDTLTGLANRWMFQQQLDATARLPDPASSYLAIHYVDLDGFKGANDAWGHPFGDEILKMAAERMRAVVREGDVVARLGGDEFAILQLSVTGAAGAQALAGRVVARLSEPYIIDKIRCNIGASVGICLAYADTPIGHVIEEADKALYVAKREGKGRFVFRSMAGERHGRMQFDPEALKAGAIG